MWLPRGLLFVPRNVVAVSFAAPRYALWAYERYHLRERYMQWFFNDDETFGVYPTALFETGFGLNAGVRTLYRGLVGKAGVFHARAGYGGRYEYVASGALETGPVWGGRLELGIETRVETHPRDRFFGIGNGDLVESAAGIDPLTDDTAVATRFRHDDVHVELAGRVRLPAHLTARAMAMWVDRTFEDDAQVGTDPLTTDVYDRMQLVGYVTDLRDVYGELELSFDTLRTTRPYLATPSPSTGWRIAGFAGLQRGLDDSPSSFARFGGDVQRYFDLWMGDRVLALRAYGEMVTSDLSRTPFVDLPSLGGPHLLRGYPRDRFRGRYAGMVSVEYMYPIQRNATGYLFVDSGRVWREGDDLGLADARVGYGIGIQVHTVRSFLGRVFLASSIDGGIELTVSFDPVFGMQTRPEAR